MDSMEPESDLLDGEHWSDEENLQVKVKEKSKNAPKSIAALKSKTISGPPNYAGVRKYVQTEFGSLKEEYPEASDKEIRAMATRRWHELTEAQRTGIFIPYIPACVNDLFFSRLSYA